MIANIALLYIQYQKIHNIHMYISLTCIRIYIHIHTYVIITQVNKPKYCLVLVLAQPAYSKMHKMKTYNIIATQPVVLET